MKTSLRSPNNPLTFRCNTFSVKMYSIIALRTLAISPFIIIDRSNDKNIYENLIQNQD